jgi:hypothetical protein
MVDLAYDIELGPHSYGRRPGTYGVVIHTTEGSDTSRVSAMSTISQQSPGGGLYAGGGSYSFIVNDADPILSVPYLEAAGGITGDHTPPSQIVPGSNPPRIGVWAPDRFPWLRQMLPAAAYADPNAYLLQISISGKTAELMGYPNVEKLATDAARIIAWAEEQPEIEDNLVVMGHFNWQTDRSDPGQSFIDLVLEKYTELTAPTVPLPPTGPIPPPDRFSDVNKSHPFFADIEWMAARGITSGFPDGTYRPDETVNRGTLAAFLHRALGD